MKFWILIVLVICQSNLISQLYWENCTNLNTPRFFFEAQVLNDHQILIMGGMDSSNTGLKSCEIFDINTNKVFMSSPMNYSHSYCSSAMNKDSVIVISGGYKKLAGLVDAAIEMYDKKNDKWIYLGDMMEERAQHTSIFLNDSILLIAGGIDGWQITNSSVELFNIKSKKNYYLGELPGGKVDQTFVKMGNNVFALFIGRSGNNNSLKSKEIYKFDPINYTWSQYDTLKSVVTLPSFLKLPNNRLITAGGISSEKPFISNGDIHIENQNGKMIFKNKLFFNRQFASMSNLDDNNVVIAGGIGDNNYTIKETEIYNTFENSISLGPSLNIARRYHKSFDFGKSGNRRVFVIGGCVDFSKPIGTIEELKRGQNAKPKIINSVNNCNEYILDVYDETGISDIKLNSNLSYNVELTNVKFNTKYHFTIKVTLIDLSKNGKFNLSVTNQNGISSIFIDEIMFNGYNQIIPNVIVINNDASLNNDTILLTKPKQNSRGSIWKREKVNLKEAFNIDFSFKITDAASPNCNDGSEIGGDGFALVFQNTDNAVCGNDEGNIGYGGLKNAVAFEFDLFKDDINQKINNNDVNGNHFAIQSSKLTVKPLHDMAYTSFINSDIPIIKNNQNYNVSFSYDKDSRLKVFLAKTGENPIEICNLENFNFNDLIELNSDNIAFLGFTASTGCSFASHQIFNWTICTNNTIISDITESETTNLNIFPNPADEYIEISLSPAGGGRGWIDSPFFKGGKGVSLEIFNIFGEKNLSPALSEGEGAKIKIDVSNLPAGIYLVRIGDKFEKFIKL